MLSKEFLRNKNYLLHSIFREDTVVMFLITVGVVVVGVGTIGILVVEVVTRISVVLIFGTFYIAGII